VHLYLRDGLYGASDCGVGSGNMILWVWRHECRRFPTLSISFSSFVFTLWLSRIAPEQQEFFSTTLTLQLRYFFSILRLLLRLFHPFQTVEAFFDRSIPANSLSALFAFGEYFEVESLGGVKLGYRFREISHRLPEYHMQGRKV
jgi:predicted ferric reductase